MAVAKSFILGLTKSEIALVRPTVSICQSPSVSIVRCWISKSAGGDFVCSSATICLSGMLAVIP
jgi:hypothetical protein